MKTPVTGDAIRQHMTYSWWKYVLVAVCAIFGVNMYFTVTAYRPPESKKVLIYVYGYANQDGLDAYMADIQREHLPEMEEMRSLMLTADDTYGAMQLSTYIAASEGDVYVIPRDEFISLASSGAFVALEEDEELMKLFNDAGVNLQSGWRKNTELEENHLYGIPLNKLPGLAKKYVAVENGFVAVLINNQNDENVMKFLRLLCADMIPDPDAQSGTAQLFDLPATPENTTDPNAN